MKAQPHQGWGQTQLELQQDQFPFQEVNDQAPSTFIPLPTEAQPRWKPGGHQLPHHQCSFSPRDQEITMKVGKLTAMDCYTPAAFTKLEPVFTSIATIAGGFMGHVFLSVLQMSFGNSDERKSQTASSEDQMVKGYVWSLQAFPQRECNQPPRIDDDHSDQLSPSVHSDQPPSVHSIQSPSVHSDQSFPSVHSNQSFPSVHSDLPFPSVHSAILGLSKTGNHSDLCFLTKGNNEFKVPVPIFRACGHNLGVPPRPHHQREGLA